MTEYHIFAIGPDGALRASRKLWNAIHDPVCVGKALQFERSD